MGTQRTNRWDNREEEDAEKSSVAEEEVVVEIDR